MSLAQKEHWNNSQFEKQHHVFDAEYIMTFFMPLFFLSGSDSNSQGSDSVHLLPQELLFQQNVKTSSSPPKNHMHMLFLKLLGSLKKSDKLLHWEEIELL